MLTTNGILIWYRAFSEFSLGFWVYQMVRGAGVTPLWLSFLCFLHLVADAVVNIMLEIYEASLSTTIINKSISVANYVLCVSCYSLCVMCSLFCWVTDSILYITSNSNALTPSTQRVGHSAEIIFNQIIKPGDVSPQN